MDSLSSGETQLVLIASALSTQSKIIILDEPTANLDQHSRLKTLELLGSLKSSGVSLMIACHEHQEFMNIADGVFNLNDGILRKI